MSMQCGNLWSGVEIKFGNSGLAFFGGTEEGGTSYSVPRQERQ